MSKTSTSVAWQRHTSVLVNMVKPRERAVIVTADAKVIELPSQHDVPEKDGMTGTHIKP